MKSKRKDAEVQLGGVGGGGLMKSIEFWKRQKQIS